MNAAVSAGDADEPAIEVLDEGTGDVHRVPLAEIERARTVFVWGPEAEAAQAGAPQGRLATRRGVDPTKNADDTDDTDDKKVSAT